MRPKIDINKLKHLPTAEDMFVDEYKSEFFKFLYPKVVNI